MYITTTATELHSMHSSAMHPVLVPLHRFLREVDPVLWDEVLHWLRTPQFDRVLDPARSQETDRGMWIHAVHNVRVPLVDLRHQVCCTFPNVEIAVVRTRDNEVAPEEIRLLDVRGCVAVAQEAVLVISGRCSPIL